MARNPTTTRVNTWEKEMADAAVDAAAVIPVSAGEAISIKGGKLRFHGQLVPNNEMEVVVLDFLLENRHFAGDYEEDNPQPPICYAFGNDEKARAPHPDSPEPQCETCFKCPLNQWGSANKGKGKQCKNTAKLAIIPAGALDAVDKIVDMDIGILRVPPTSLKRFNDLVQKAASLKRPPFGVIARISADMDPYPVVNFELVEQITDGEAIGAIMEKRKTLKLDTPYQAAAEAPAKPATTKTRNFGRRS